MTRRPGFALVLSLLIAAALSLVGLGVMALAIREAGIVGTLADGAQARATAEMAALDVVQDWSTRAYSSLEIGDSRTVANDLAEVQVSRADTALFLVRATGRAGSETRLTAPATATVGLLVRTFSIPRALRHVPAAVTAAGTARLHAGWILGGGSCDTVPAVMAPDLVVESAHVVGAMVEREPGPSAGALPQALRSAATVRVGPGVIRPRASVALGECRNDPTNWGSPDPGHPCFTLRPVIAATGPLRVAGGSGRGVMVVDGDVTLSDGFRFQGLIVARGRMVVGQDVWVDGAIRADTVIVDGGQVVAAPCSVLDLLSAPGLDRAFQPPSRWWIPVF